MENLPNELLAKIARYVNRDGSKLYEMYNLRRVCKRFSEALAYTTMLTHEDKKIIDKLREYKDLLDNHTLLLKTHGRREVLSIVDTLFIEKLKMDNIFDNLSEFLSKYDKYLVRRLETIIRNEKQTNDLIIIFKQAAYADYWYAPHRRANNTV